MYQILGIRLALTLFGLLCAAVFTLWAVLAPPAEPVSLMDWWKIGSGAVSSSGLAVALIGQSSLFPLLCRLPLVRNWFPPIDGDWKASLGSNWQAMQPLVHPGNARGAGAPVSATVTIVARLFHIRMNLVSGDRYSTSRTLFVRASRDPEDGSINLYYIYRNTTDLPKDTDSGSHEGAGLLRVERRGSEICMDGVYWTNRNWHLGLNTAGKIELKRA